MFVRGVVSEHKSNEMVLRFCEFRNVAFLDIGGPCAQAPDSTSALKSSPIAERL